MRLFIEAFVSAIIALLVLNFFGLALYTLTSLTSFFVILLFIVAIEEKTGISNRRVLKQMRLERPIFSTVIAFMILIILALVFSILHDRIGIIVAPLVSATVELGLIGLAAVLAIAYRLFYHVLFKGIVLDTGIDLGIKRRFGENKVSQKARKDLVEKVKRRAKEGERKIDIQRTVEE